MRNNENYIEQLYRERIEELLRNARKEFPEDYRLFIKIRAYYTKIQATNLTTYTRLTRLRSACREVRELFRKPLVKLTREEWEIFSEYLYSKYCTRDGIITMIHPLRLVLKFLGYSEEEAKKLFPYPSSLKAKLQHKAPPPYVPGHVLDKVVFAIPTMLYRALYCLMRITGARTEEVILLRRENIVDDEENIIVRFNVTKNGLPREVPLNWPGFEKHLKTIIDWYYYDHPDPNNPKAWLFPRKNDPTRPVGRNLAYLPLKRAKQRLAKEDPEIRKYYDYIHPHQFRHTRAYELVFQNWNIRWIMAYMGWKKVDMVLRYTQALEVKQVHKIITNKETKKNITKCPRCGATIPEGARYCPGCGLKLTQDIQEVIKINKDKEKLKKYLLRLLEEIGVEGLKELLLST